MRGMKIGGEEKLFLAARDVLRVGHVLQQQQKKMCLFAGGRQASKQEEKTQGETRQWRVCCVYVYVWVHVWVCVGFAIRAAMISLPLYSSTLPLFVYLSSFTVLLFL